MALLALGRLAAVGLALWTTAAGRPLLAQTPARTLEYSVKAAYLLNFTRYVEWPADTASRAPVVLCVYGADPFDSLLEQTLTGRTSKGRRLVVRRHTDPENVSGCHAVFLTDEEWRRRPAVLDALTRRGILTVGEGDAFADAGGTISFVIVDNVVRFVINVTAGEKAGLRLSSRLLSIATRLIGKDP